MATTSTEWLKINEHHETCRGQLIDSWKSERLIEYMVTASKYAGFKNTKDTIEAKKLW